MSQATVHLRPGKASGLRAGYPWVFQNQLASIEGRPTAGAVVHIQGADGTHYGQGLYHPDAQIAVRFLTSDPAIAIDDTFFYRRVEQAIARRRTMLADLQVCRLIFSESDGLPGTVVEKYGPVLTWSTLSYGMAQRRDTILLALDDLLKPTAIVERNDHWLRKKEGLEEQTSVLRGRYAGEVLIKEAGLTFAVDALRDPMTGLALDQRQHRAVVRQCATGRRVLDAYAAQGAYGLQAAAGGATDVHMLEISTPARERAAANAERNGLRDRIRLEAVDALQHLGGLAREGARYDLVLLHPPAFARSRRQIASATRAYEELNTSAFELLAPGGLLATTSASPAIDEEAFVAILRESAQQAGTGLRVLHRGHQPPDFPTLESMDETRYLSFFLLEKTDDAVPGVQRSAPRAA